jgi:predicted aspartyl protease
VRAGPSPRHPRIDAFGRRRSRVAAAVAVGLLLTGCELDLGADRLAPEEDAFEDVETPTSPDGRTVPLEVGEAAAGGGTLVFVPVHIDGEGPYTFVLDTGASNTAIDAELAEELGLSDAGLEGSVEGVTGEGAGTLVSVESWRLGDVELDSQRILAIELGGGRGPLADFDGLLGSDVLSKFGSVTIDYDAGVFVLPE